LIAGRKKPKVYLGVELDQALHGLIALGKSVQDFAPPSGAEHAYAVHDAERQDQQQSR
jgi:hypothetical protein